MQQDWMYLTKLTMMLDEIWVDLECLYDHMDIYAISMEFMDFKCYKRMLHGIICLLAYESSPVSSLAFTSHKITGYLATELAQNISRVTCASKLQESQVLIESTGVKFKSMRRICVQEDLAKLKVTIKEHLYNYSMFMFTSHLGPLFLE